MKISIIKSFLGAIFMASFAISCQSNVLPKVKNATYSSYSNADQKGYWVEFELSHDSIAPKSVVLNNILQEITPENKTDKKYKINVIAQSTAIFGFKPKLVEKENGIYFVTDTADVFRAVDFKLK
ncbi:hypothetical protein [Cloacibacterium normanense]|uniref:Putative lipoprotein n=1 Tax=Cloacibacterium normanense TaxID=237258 RepID=A0A1E5UBR9_9FLAO|nr:hypothetical protein [Cloacibacterium normanense]AZI70304.1 hypothetical protein EB819_10625 [Cloacibacterium normanense]OEL10366.1 putative lipoprotein [Cloacibacterium normanense]SDO37620.1 hypothetical protein SAMN04489756_105160 [Cloacibacterium normanense]